MMELPILKPWEFHPMLVHFPIAFLLAGVTMELFALRRPNETLHRATAWLLLAGAAFGWLAAAAGGLAYLTVPAHTERGHELMYWHLGLGLSMLAIFSWISISCWRRKEAAPNRPHLIGTLFGAVLLILTGHLGGLIVFHHGAGVDPRILAPEIRSGHSHQGGHSSSSDSGASHNHSEATGLDPHGHE